MSKNKHFYRVAKRLLSFFMATAISLSLLMALSLVTVAGSLPVANTGVMGTEQRNLLKNMNLSAVIDSDSPVNVVLSSTQEQDKTGNYNKRGFVYSEHIPLSRDLQEHIYNCAEDQGLDYTLILALIWRESRFNSDAIGYNSNGTTDSGLMQINDVNRSWLKNQHGITDLIDAYENVRAGTYMLGMFVEDHGLHYGLLAYQWGEGGMLNRKNAGITTSEALEALYEKQLEFELLLYGDSNSKMFDA